MCTASSSSLTVLGSTVCGNRACMALQEHGLIYPLSQGSACDPLFGLRHSEWGPSAACLPFCCILILLDKKAASHNPLQIALPPVPTSPLCLWAAACCLHWHLLVSTCEWLPNNSSLHTMHYATLPSRPIPETAALDWGLHLLRWIRNTSYCGKR